MTPCSRRGKPLILSKSFAASNNTADNPKYEDGKSTDYFGSTVKAGTENVQPV